MLPNGGNTPARFQPFESKQSVLFGVSIHLDLNPNLQINYMEIVLLLDNSEVDILIYHILLSEMFPYKTEACIFMLALSFWEIGLLSDRPHRCSCGSGEITIYALSLPISPFLGCLNFHEHRIHENGQLHVYTALVPQAIRQHAGHIHVHHNSADVTHVSGMKFFTTPLSHPGDEEPNIVGSSVVLQGWEA